MSSVRPTSRSFAENCSGCEFIWSSHKHRAFIKLWKAEAASSAFWDEQSLIKHNSITNWLCNSFHSRQTASILWLHHCSAKHPMKIPGGKATISPVWFTSQELPCFGSFGWLWAASVQWQALFFKQHLDHRHIVPYIMYATPEAIIWPAGDRVGWCPANGTQHKQAM